MEFIKIEAQRGGYSPDQCGSTMTVSELIDELSGYDASTPVYLSHDGGYTYGAIMPYDIDCDEC